MEGFADEEKRKIHIKLCHRRFWVYIQLILYRCPARTAVTPVYRPESASVMGLHCGVVYPAPAAFIIFVLRGLSLSVLCSLLGAEQPILPE
jgi:hypothetical protein